MDWPKGWGMSEGYNREDSDKEFGNDGTTCFT